MTARSSTRHLCVVLHDVAPGRWAQCQRLMAQLQAIAGTRLPLTLLVVPQPHSEACEHGEHVWGQRELRWLHRMVSAGHEIALHGLTHPGDAQRRPAAQESGLMALDRAQTEERLDAALAWANQNGLPVSGFVPPAGQMNDAGWDAVADAGFHYSCTPDCIVSLPERREMAARRLVFSPRSAWRRVASVAWNNALGWHQRHSPLLRLDLHPADADHPLLSRCWQRLLWTTLRDRQPLRLSEAAMLAARTD